MSSSPSPISRSPLPPAVQFKIEKSNNNKMVQKIKEDASCYDGVASRKLRYSDHAIYDKRLSKHI